MPIRTDDTLLRMALAGYEVELQNIQAKIAELKARLGGRARGGAAPTGNTSPSGRKRTMSPAARRRIAAAQKKRWAEYRKKRAA